MDNRKKNFVRGLSGAGEFFIIRQVKEEKEEQIWQEKYQKI